MSVLSRPLFRQMGGPAQPMPQDMAPAPPPMAPPQPQMDPEMARQAGVLEKTEMEARASGEQLGAEYAQNMMAGIDGAQSTEDLINALRGNDKPLDARREELAGYVGQGDADQTPESVLAMVQPVIMMTEEGAMDSGIGALVQQITGDVEMTTADGAPTDMGMGVGSLMAAGAQEAPAPQNFRQGGEVAHLEDGSTPTSTAGGFSPLTFDFGSEVKTQYETLMPLFQSIVDADARAAEAEERKKMDEAQTLLALARGGLRLAAGDPKSGGSLASQIGSAFEPTAAEIAALGAQAQDRKDAIRAQDQQLRVGALQAGLGQAGAQQKYAQDLDLATQEAALRMGTIKPDLRVVTDNATGKTVYIDVASPAGKTQIASINALNADSPEGNAFTVNTVSSEDTGNAKVFMIDGVQRLSFRPGYYLDNEGEQVKIPPTGAIPLGDDLAYEIGRAHV